MTVTAETRSSRSNPRRGWRGLFRAHTTPGGLRWILPGFVLSVGLIYYCIGYSGYLSLFKWGGGKQKMTWVGLDNFRQAFDNPVFWASLRHTLFFFVVVYVVQVVGGVLFASVMHSQLYFKTLYKIIIFIPVVIAPAIMAPAHIQVWSTKGTVNQILSNLGLESLTRGWIGQASTSLLVVTLVQCWGAVGFGFILYYAAIGQIDPEVMEAARIDGAGNLRALISIVLPEVRPTTVSLGILNFITALKLFDNPWLLTQGGPAHSSEFLGTMIYSQMVQQKRNLGYACALSMVLLVVAVVTSVIIQLRGRERDPQTRKRTRRKAEEVAI
ncbi:MAG: sugar ABC transporter permease [Bifidobacteriaceae bacterium]|jgi:ABC-type sugar transport system permease subunit|nr:sugar ABC transporter permease [Bifidobacteriaceae bacterium]